VYKDRVTTFIEIII